ncbi:MAG: AbrB/MazE/SpoVT family DNA-binding domain-containing protein [Gemmatimonadetes bacterium]|nr:AbrB/MazE/SpoVT family DNA-binding domain-containing protein [Gemmatimonadota bacterium]MCY3613453.1 AbrB/MazE/SpoVT family DNA-binding domain-containing protein [Gemmatimonadota bacterium]MCY3677721.1 AbrB/MazE/SpoVT family DNA-binding domain-containing protein [Gemmatimonadota bacterium]MYA41738.1 AbrB/MazE/SpoVT family DNA-binding domain-containing protein [Gemmatimonadota bacterium]MYJ10371.1 AbrB/MazE/SpoVT family DNA-binding domain-containing protein [Gemmatimonadota bacterium]
MEFSRITARGQTTIPKRIREAANLREGDVLAFDVRGDQLVVRRVTPGPDGYLHGLSNTMSEWIESEDEEAWRDL